MPLETIKQRCSPNPFQGQIGHGDVRKFADMTRYHLRSAHQIASVMFVGEGPTEESVEALLRQLEAGLPAEALELLLLPASLSQGEYRRCTPQASRRRSGSGRRWGSRSPASSARSARRSA